MNIEVRYLSKSGNTKKLAEAIAKEVNATAEPITEKVASDTDILFLGGAVYAFGIDAQLKSFIENLPDSVKKVAVFSTTAVVQSAYPHMKKILVGKSIPVLDEEFHCKGAFKFMHKGRPNTEDLKGAKEFARNVINSLTGR